MSTTKDIIKQALRNIGVTASGEEPGSDELQDAYLIFQQMVDDWSLSKGLVVETHESFETNTVGAASSYTIGSGGDLNTAWPIRILDCRARDAGNTETTITVVGLDQWSSVPVKNVVQIPSYVYYKPAYPLGTLYFDKIWLDNYTMKLVTWKEITALPSLNSALAYAPGYERALRLNLELELCPAFERPVSAVTATLAASAKRKIKRMNHTPIHSRVDDGLLPRRRGYNIDAGP